MTQEKDKKARDFVTLGIRRSDRSRLRAFAKSDQRSIADVVSLLVADEIARRKKSAENN